MKPREKTNPNLVYILADDMGYGDASCLNPKGKIKTPNIDRLATDGMIFTDTHSHLGGLFAIALQRAGRTLQLAFDAAEGDCGRVW